VTGAIGLPGLRGRRVLVTGAASGIGLATATRLAHEGCAVAFVDRSTGIALPDVEELTVAIEADVRDEAAVEAAVLRAEELFGGLDVVIANAAIEPPDDDRADRMPLELWQRTIDTNLTGAFLTCKHGLRALLRSDCDNRSVILTLSPTGMRAVIDDKLAYSTSKAALFGLMRNMARDYAAEGIRVNGVMPGFTRTAGTAPIFADAALLAEVSALVPLGRHAEPEEIAGMMAWVASDEARFATGSVFPIDGGQMAV
jgi:NAD(P)-dependent dehydrogenase (short-subunit alcohol dehydrogenase family)